MPSIDYAQSGIWDRLAARLEEVSEPRPSFNCGRVACGPDWTWQPRLGDYDFWLVVKGRGVVQLQAQSYALTPGTLLIYRPGDTGRAEQDPADRLTVTYVHFDFFAPGSQARAALPADWLPSRCVQFPDPAPLDVQLTRVVRLLERRDRLAQVEAKLVFGQALLAAYRQDAAAQGLAPTQPDPRLARVIAHLHDHPDERLSQEEAARLAGLSPGYFSQRFTQAMGLSFRAYALHTRLERARHLLEETAMPVGAIARALGYDDIFLFSRQFKARYGRAPSRVRGA
ncbi:MAG: helix-turn-helix domain-containing protein [Thermomicrobiales bacterium]